MYTQCPECLTVFKVECAELAAAHANVRCSHCNAVFNALPRLSERLPAEPIGEFERHPETESPPQLGLPVFRPQRTAAPSLRVGREDRPRAHERAPTAPQFARHRRASARSGNGKWLLGNLALLLLLGGQIAWAERNLWLDTSGLRPWLESACARLGCSLPLRHDESLLQLASRDIRPHPSVPGALIISATVRNVADFAQAFPTVEITLSDLDEQRIAMRRFRPQDYIGDPRALAHGLAPQATAPLVFEVADPGKNAVAFEFRFE